MQERKSEIPRWNVNRGRPAVLLALFPLFILSLLVVIPFGLGAAEPPQAPADYFIDSRHGSDQADGRSAESPWRSFAPLASIRLGPADRLLLKRGSVFNAILELEAVGEPGKPIVVDTYGAGEKPLILAPDSAYYGLRLKNSSFVRIQNLEIVNQGSTPLAKRTGIKIENHNFGVSKDIILRALDIRDVNGSRVKSEGGGSGILIQSRSEKVPSKFDGLIIEHCTLKRCERNGIIFDTGWDRSNWFPSTGVQIRYNSIEEVPGDGIVPIGCQGAVIAYNKMFNSPATLPQSEAAAGIWPWSCDDTLIEFNEVSDHKAPWDAQGFDADYNCRNTTIRYNFSHDNEGGFVLICDAGQEQGYINVGNLGTRVLYNISLDDAVRSRMTRAGIFSPSIHIAGPVQGALIAHNVLLAGPKPDKGVDKSMLTSDSWNGLADGTRVLGNLFVSVDSSAFRLNGSTGNDFSQNYYYGDFSGVPEAPPVRYTGQGRQHYETLKITVSALLDSMEIAGGQQLRYVNPEKIRLFFEQL